MDIETALLDAFKSVKDESNGSKLEGYLALTDSVVSIIKSALYQEAYAIKCPSDNHVKVIIQKRSQGWCTFSYFNGHAHGWIAIALASTHPQP